MRIIYDDPFIDISKETNNIIFIGICVAWLYISSFLYCNKMKIKTVSILSKLQHVRFFLIFFFLVSLDNIFVEENVQFIMNSIEKKKFNLPSNNNVSTEIPCYFTIISVDWQLYSNNKTFDTRLV